MLSSSALENCIRWCSKEDRDNILGRVQSQESKIASCKRERDELISNKWRRKKERLRAVSGIFSLGISCWIGIVAY